MKDLGKKNHITDSALFSLTETEGKTPPNEILAVSPNIENEETGMQQTRWHGQRPSYSAQEDDTVQMMQESEDVRGENTAVGPLSVKDTQAIQVPPPESIDDDQLPFIAPIQNPGYVVEEIQISKDEYASLERQIEEYRELLDKLTSKDDLQAQLTQKQAELTNLIHECKQLKSANQKWADNHATLSERTRTAEEKAKRIESTETAYISLQEEIVPLREMKAEYEKMVEEKKHLEEQLNKYFVFEQETLQGILTLDAVVKEGKEAKSKNAQADELLASAKLEKSKVETLKKEAEEKLAAAKDTEQRAANMFKEADTEARVRVITEEVERQQRVDFWWKWITTALAGLCMAVLVLGWWTDINTRKSGKRISRHKKVKKSRTVQTPPKSQHAQTGMFKVRAGISAKTLFESNAFLSFDIQSLGTSKVKTKKDYSVYYTLQPAGKKTSCKGSNIIEIAAFLSVNPTYVDNAGRGKKYWFKTTDKKYLVLKQPLFPIIGKLAELSVTITSMEQSAQMICLSQSMQPSSY